MLLVFGGLPGTGKTTLAKCIVPRLSAVHIRIDTIEQAMRDAGMTIKGPEGYLVGYALAADNLRLGHTVIADSVNPVEITRSAWRDVARRCNQEAVEIEVVCSDADKHRQRVESRTADLPGHEQPTWQQVLDRHYEPWNGSMVIDTAGHTPEQSAILLTHALENLDRK